MENKKYRQDKVYFWFSITMLVILGIVIPFLFFVPIIYGLYYYRTYIELTDKGVRVNKGAIFHSEKYLLYSKINNVELKRSVFSFGEINIFVGNDVPVSFVNIEKGKELRDLILDKMDNK